MFVDDAKLAFLQRVCDLLPFVPTLRRKRALLPAIRELHGLAMGRPTNETLKSVYWAAGQAIPDTDDPNPDQGSSGMIYLLPMLPMEPRVAREVVDLSEAAFGAQGFHPYTTLNFIDRKTLEAVINISFDRSDKERTRQAVDVVRNWRRRSESGGGIRTGCAWTRWTRL